MINDSIKIKERAGFTNDNNGNFWIGSMYSKYNFIRFKDGIYTDATKIFKTYEI